MDENQKWLSNIDTMQEFYVYFVNYAAKHNLGDTALAEIENLFDHDGDLVPCADEKDKL